MVTVDEEYAEPLATEADHLFANACEELTRIEAALDDARGRKTRRAA